MASFSVIIYICIVILSVGSMAKTVYDFTVKDIDGNDVSLSKYKGRLLLIVNVASQCGYTDSNYKSLQATYEEFKDNGLSIAAFPCNQFGKQEPWENSEVKSWVKDNYSVTFDMYAKVDVKGSGASDLFKFLVRQKWNERKPISWNFDGKFLIDKTGELIRRFDNDTPLKKINQIVNTKIGGEDNPIKDEL